MLLEDYYFTCRCRRCTDELKNQSKLKVSYPQSDLKKPSGKNKAKRAATKREKRLASPSDPLSSTTRDVAEIQLDVISPAD